MGSQEMSLWKTSKILICVEAGQPTSAGMASDNNEDEELGMLARLTSCPSFLNFRSKQTGLCYLGQRQRSGQDTSSMR